jgi:hypothetical protein
MFFEPLIKELRGNLDRKDFVVQFHRFNRFKPGFKGLMTDIVFDNVKTTAPDLVMILAHSWKKKLSSLINNLC